MPSTKSDADKAQRTAIIRTLNDQLRTEAKGNGTVLITQGVQALGNKVMGEIVHAIQSFDEFSEDNDPYNEHDFGVVTVEGNRILWKIDYYDLACEYGSPDPSDETVTHRVLTVMLSSEY